MQACHPVCYYGYETLWPLTVTVLNIIIGDWLLVLNDDDQEGQKVIKFCNATSKLVVSKLNPLTIVIILCGEWWIEWSQ